MRTFLKFTRLREGFEVYWQFYLIFPSWYIVIFEQYQMQQNKVYLHSDPLNTNLYKIISLIQFYVVQNIARTNFLLCLQDSSISVKDKIGTRFLASCMESFILQ